VHREELPFLDSVGTVRLEVGSFSRWADIIAQTLLVDYCLALIASKHDSHWYCVDINET
jgi:hypothetical protein